MIRGARASRQKQLARWGLLGVSGLAALLLCVSAITSHRGASLAGEALARGQAQMWVHSLTQQLRVEAGPPTNEVLAQLVDAQHGSGLRYLALLGGRGEVLVEAGSPLFAIPESLPHGELFAMRPEGVRAIALSPPRGRHDRPPEPFHRPPPRLLMDFEPQLALAMKDRATRSLVLSLLASLVLLVTALVLWRLSVRAQDVEARLEEQRHLAAMGEMSAVLAHEIRNPLASLKGHAQLMAERLPQGEWAREKADRVVGEAIRLEGLITNLLSFARAGQIERHPASPTDILEAAALAVDPERITLDVSRAPARHSLDAAHMEQVLTNLLRNAVQSSPETVHASAELDQDALVYTVRDHGSGISPEAQERLFDAFFTTRVRGTGLGLTLAKRVVELHGGRIDAENHPEGGAVFRIWIPPT
jgi:two-component system sensor histidine kinase HydH